MMTKAVASAGLTMILLSGVTAWSFPVSAQEPAAAQGKLTKVASFEHQVTGVTVAKDGRMFVNFPRWSEDALTLPPGLPSF